MSVILCYAVQSLLICVAIEQNYESSLNLKPHYHTETTTKQGLQLL